MGFRHWYYDKTLWLVLTAADIELAIVRLDVFSNALPSPKLQHDYYIAIKIITMAEPIKVTPLQSLAIWVTIILTVILIIFAIVAATSFSDINVPQPELKEGDATVQEANTKKVANYKSWVETEYYRREHKFDFAVTKILIPVFDALIKAVLLFLFAQKAATVLNTYVAAKFGAPGSNSRSKS